jgi:hypothetical protein
MVGGSGKDRQERLESSGFPRHFADALGAWADTLKGADRRHADALFGKAVSVNAKSVKNWRSAVAAPPADTWLRVKEKLSEAVANATRMEALEAAWADARGLRNEPRSPPPRALEQTIFEPVTRRNPDTQLVDFAVSATQGSTLSHIELVPTLDFGDSPFEIDGVRFAVSVRRVKLLYDAKGCDPKPGSKYEKPPACVVEGAAWVFSAPEGASLRGPQLRGEALIVLSAPAERAEVRLHVQCDDESAFIVNIRAPEQSLTGSTEKIAAQFLKKKAFKREMDGTYRIASAGLKIKKAKQ